MCTNPKSWLLNKTVFFRLHYSEACGNFKAYKILIQKYNFSQKNSAENKNNLTELPLPSPDIL